MVPRVMQFDNIDSVYSYFLWLLDKAPVQFGAFGLERVKFLASLLGNPQDTYPVIHIAGTSGKWSTAYMTSRILQAHGLQVWLHVSPHLLDWRERVQVHNAFVSDAIIFTAAEKLVDAVEQCRTSQYGNPSYYEVMMVFAYLCFALVKVDVAVIEVWCGGTYDGSNIVSRQDKISVITRQGYDHQDLLGDTLEDIASNDVGIILPGSRVVALHQHEDVCNQVIMQGAQEKGVELCWITQQDCTHVRIENGQTVFDYIDENGEIQKDIHLALVWLFQAENGALAISVSQLFLDNFDRAKARDGLLQSWFVWRCDVRDIGWRTIVLDGAHNPQKMQALVDTLRVLYPGKNVVRYTAFKQWKDREEMLGIMSDLSQKFVLWSFAGAQDMSFHNVDIEQVTNYLSTASVEECLDPTEFFRAMEKYVGEDEVVVITGSLYWLSRVYKHL
jgi:dihydrofolate synthase/folylpolyglutamate synthase